MSKIKSTPKPHYDMLALMQRISQGKTAGLTEKELEWLGASLVTYGKTKKGKVRNIHLTAEAKKLLKLVDRLADLKDQAIIMPKGKKATEWVITPEVAKTLLAHEQAELMEPIGHMHAFPRGMGKTAALSQITGEDAEVALGAKTSLMYRALLNRDIGIRAWFDFMLPTLQGNRVFLHVPTGENATYIGKLLSMAGIQFVYLKTNDTIDQKQAKMATFMAGKATLVLLDKDGVRAAAPEVVMNHPLMLLAEQARLPQEVLLSGRPAFDMTFNLGNEPLREEPVDWRRMSTPEQVLLWFPSKPSTDDILDLFNLNQSLRSNRIEHFLQKLRKQM